LRGLRIRLGEFRLEARYFCGFLEAVRAFHLEIPGRHAQFRHR
jgi:hypothetical protein